MQYYRTHTPPRKVRLNRYWKETLDPKNLTFKELYYFNMSKERYGKTDDSAALMKMISNLKIY